MRMRSFSVAIALALTGGAFAAEEGTGAMVRPQYNDEGALILPVDFREWVFVGASLGLSYTQEEAAEERRLFHHVYIQPEAYRHYVETGEFVDNTMLVMENYSAGKKESNALHGEKEFQNLNGHFEQNRVGLEVALKDEKRFEEKWAYFNFSRAGALAETAKAFPKAVCWSCHNRHGADDNVFVQFYPILREKLDARRAAADDGSDKKDAK